MNLHVPPPQSPAENLANKKEKSGQAGLVNSETPEGASIEQSKEEQSKPSQALGENIIAYKASFSIDDMGNTIIKVVDKEGEFVKQIPPEKILEAVRVLAESFEKLSM